MIGLMLDDNRRIAVEVLLLPAPVAALPAQAHPGRARDCDGVIRDRQALLLAGPHPIAQGLHHWIKAHNRRWRT